MKATIIKKGKGIIPKNRVYTFKCTRCEAIYAIVGKPYLSVGISWWSFDPKERCPACGKENLGNTKRYIQTYMRLR